MNQNQKIGFYEKKAGVPHARFLNLEDKINIAQKIIKGKQPFDNLHLQSHLVYFLISEQSRAVKIGYNYTLLNSVKALQVANPHPLSLVLYVPGDNSLKSDIHQTFSSGHLHDDWFTLTSELQDFINQLKVKVFEGRWGEYEAQYRESLQLSSRFRKVS